MVYPIGASVPVKEMSSPTPIFLILALAHTVGGFSPSTHLSTARFAGLRRIPARTLVYAKEDYTEVQKLRAEVESPFSQVRLFALPVLFVGALIATYFAATGLLASAVGARDPSPDGVTDLLIDLASVGTTGYLWRRETQVRDSRLKRIAFGSKMAALRITQLNPVEGTLRPGARVTLADLRRGRGQARRVVLLLAPEETLKESLAAACAIPTELASADFLIVPLIAANAGAALTLTAPSLEMLQALARPEVLSAAAQAAAPSVEARVATSKETQPPLPWDAALVDSKGDWPIALPNVGGDEWSSALSSDLEQAVKQDASALTRGLTLILKKNGRVGTRRLGMPNWDGLLADVEGRRRAGLDVTNI